MTPLFDLIAAVELGASATVVTLGLAWLFGASWPERAAIVAGLAAWLAGVVALGAGGVLQPERLGTPGLAVAVLLPVAVLCGLGLGTRAGRARIAAASLPGMVALHAVRLLGVSFVLLHAAGRLPAPFAPTAGWGDIAVALLALPVAWLAARRAHGSGAAVLAWSVLGSADLAVAVFLGATSSPGPVRLFFAEPGAALMTTLPWLLIPGFLVPALFSLHVATLWRLGAGRLGAIAVPLSRLPAA